jgi:hypothetical protein
METCEDGKSSQRNRTGPISVAFGVDFQAAGGNDPYFAVRKLAWHRRFDEF